MHEPTCSPQWGLSARQLFVAPGHSQVELTFCADSHLLPELRREIADRMDDVHRRLQPPPDDARVAEKVENAGDEVPAAGSDADDSPAP